MSEGRLRAKSGTGVAAKRAHVQNLSAVFVLWLRVTIKALLSSIAPSSRTRHSQVKGIT